MIQEDEVKMGGRGKLGTPKTDLRGKCQLDIIIIMIVACESSRRDKSNGMLGLK